MKKLNTKKKYRHNRCLHCRLFNTFKPISIKISEGFLVLRTECTICNYQFDEFYLLKDFYAHLYWLTNNNASEGAICNGFWSSPILDNSNIITSLSFKFSLSMDYFENALSMQSVRKVRTHSTLDPEILSHIQILKIFYSTGKYGSLYEVQYQIHNQVFEGFIDTVNNTANLPHVKTEYDKKTLQENWPEAYDKPGEPFPSHIAEILRAIHTRWDKLYAEKKFVFMSFIGDDLVTQKEANYYCQHTNW